MAPGVTARPLTARRLTRRAALVIAGLFACAAFSANAARAAGELTTTFSCPAKTVCDANFSEEPFYEMSVGTSYSYVVSLEDFLYSDTVAGYYGEASGNSGNSYDAKNLFLFVDLAYNDGRVRIYNFANVARTFTVSGYYS